MDQYDITGMSCAACVARVEKAVSAVPGVESCSVSLLTNSMGVTGSADEKSIIAAVEAAGYGAGKKGAASKGKAESRGEDALADRETPVLKRRMFWSLGFLCVLMYVSMGHGMWGWPLPGFFCDNPVAVGLLQLLLTGAVMVINQKFFISGFKSAFKLSPNMDTLVALGASAAFIYSTVVLFGLSGAVAEGNAEKIAELSHEYYFESAAMILALITVGKLLEARSKGKTTSALKSLLKLAPRTATLIRDGREETVDVEEVRPEDIFAVRPGESIPVDGVVVEGHTAVDESALTGESLPVDKDVGMTVSAGTLNRSGFVKCRATRVGENTTIAGIIKMVSDAAATKAPIARVADKVAGFFVPVVMGIALVTTALWLILGSEGVGYALARGISVLVISCPCAMGLATPVAIMVGSGLGAKNGILFKSASALETAGRVSVVALDKTGTVTRGTPEVTDIVPAEGVSEAELTRLAYGLEAKSEHPLGKSIVSHAEKLGAELASAENFEILPGNGLVGTVEGRAAFGGNGDFAALRAEADPGLAKIAAGLAAEGKTPIYFGADGKLWGVIAVADAIKPESPGAIAELKNMGLRVVMLTGDNGVTARAIASRAGIDEVISDVLPEGKEAAVRELSAQGRVAMVGDGINDAPALTRADVGIAIGAGTDVAIDAADIVLVNSSLSDVPAAVRLGRRTLRIIKQNLFWAFIYNILGIPLAAGLFIPLLNWELSPMFGAAAMSISSFCVVSNALRLNLFDVHDPVHDRKIKQKIKKEKKPMNRTLKIEGMMCPHCEARVKKVLEAMEGVALAEVSYKEGTAVVTLSAKVSDEALKKTVEDAGYTVL